MIIYTLQRMVNNPIPRLPDWCIPLAHDHTQRFSVKIVKK